MTGKLCFRPTVLKVFFSRTDHLKRLMVLGVLIPNIGLFCGTKHLENLHCRILSLLFSCNHGCVCFCRQIVWPWRGHHIIPLVAFVFHNRQYTINSSFIVYVYLSVLDMLPLFLADISTKYQGWHLWAKNPCWFKESARPGLDLLLSYTH